MTEANTENIRFHEKFDTTYFCDDILSIHLNISAQVSNG